MEGSIIVKSYKNEQKIEVFNKSLWFFITYNKTKLLNEINQIILKKIQIILLIAKLKKIL